MEKDRNDRGNSSDQRKKLSYAKEHTKGKKFRVIRPEHRSKCSETDDTAINTVLGTLTGGHHDTVRRFENASKTPNAQVYDVTDTEKTRQVQKAQFIKQQLEKSHNCEGYGTHPNMSYDVPDGTKNDRSGEREKTDVPTTELSAFTERISDDPQLVERLRKAQFIREQLENSAEVTAIMSYSDGESIDVSDHTDPPYHIESGTDQRTSDKESTINSSLSSQISMLNDEQKDDIQRSIKQKLYESSHDERRQHQEPVYSEKTQIYTADEKAYEPQQTGILDEVGAAVSYAQSVHTADIQKSAVKPVTDTVKKYLGDTAQTAADGVTTVSQSVSCAESTQAVPYNIGMILAENEGKKLAYKIAKGEDVLAEKEQVRVQERMAQSKYRFVEPDKHTPKVEKRETIQQEQKRRFINSTENKKAEVRREAEHKAKENIYLKANRKENGLIGKIFGDEKKKHPKGKGAVIAGAAAAAIPILLLVVIVMFICALFSWMAPHKESLFDAENAEYNDNDLKTEQEVLRGYIQLIDEIFEEEQLGILEVVDKNFGGFDPDDYQYDHKSDDEHNEGEVTTYMMKCEASVITKKKETRSGVVVYDHTETIPNIVVRPYKKTYYYKTDPMTGKNIYCKKDEAQKVKTVYLLNPPSVSQQLYDADKLAESDKDSLIKYLLQNHNTYRTIYNKPGHTLSESGDVKKDTPNGSFVVGTYSVVSYCTDPNCSVEITTGKIQEELDHGNDIWDLYQYENKWIRLGNSFDYEYIIAIAAAKKFQKMENDDSIDFSDYVYNLTKEDFKDVIGNIYSASYQFSPNQICPEENCCMREDGPFHSWEKFPNGHVILKGRVVNFTEMDMEEASYTYVLNKSLDMDVDTFESDKLICDAYVEYIRQRLSVDGETPSHTVIPDWANDEAAMAKLIARYEYETGNTYQQWLLDEGIVDSKYFEELREQRKELLKNSGRYGKAEETGDE